MQGDEKPRVLDYLGRPPEPPGWRGCPAGAWIGIVGGWCLLAAAVINAIAALAPTGPISDEAVNRILLGFIITVPIAAVFFLVGIAKLERAQRRYPDRHDGAGLFVAGAVGGTISALAGTLILMALLAAVL